MIGRGDRVLQAEKNHKGGTNPQVLPNRGLYLYFSKQSYFLPLCKILSCG